jgi:hypothetical protein
LIFYQLLGIVLKILKRPESSGPSREKGMAMKGEKVLSPKFVGLGLALGAGLCPDGIVSAAPLLLSALLSLIRPSGLGGCA